MARARNIKPGFFKNEFLAEVEAFDRLLFIGLWCLADREGRLEDRPKRIKMELFPCDMYDVSVGLESLEKQGFIKRYSVKGFDVIEVVNFAKHQSPHSTEKDSELPDENGYLTVNERTKTGCITGKAQLLNSDLTLDNVKPPLDNALIPDSLIPDSLIPEVNTPPKKSSAVSLKTFLDQCEKDGTDAVESDDPIFEYAEKVGISADALHLCWLEFKERHLANGKRQKDWRATYRNAVRDNWYKLWYIGTDGHAVETSQGRQAAKLHGGDHASA